MNDTHSEAPMSVSSTLYYRGVSITITKRDGEAKIKPLVEKQLEMIDWMLDEKKCKPSWNQQTNEEIAGAGKDKPVPVSEFEDKCDKCGSPKGTSKAGNRYCLAKCWLKK